MLQGSPANSTLKELKALIGMRVSKFVNQQRNARAVEHLDARHIDGAAPRIAQIERKEVEVIVDFAGVAIVLGVAADDCVVAGVEHGPRWRGEADTARVEAFEDSAVLAKDMREPRQAWLAG